MMILMDFDIDMGIREVTRQAEANYIIAVLNLVNWNISKAAEILKINRSTSPKRKINLLGIFRLGLTISRKFILTEIPLQLIQEAQ